MSEVPWDQLEQPPLWHDEQGENELGELRERLERARSAWQQVRLHRAEEEQYWQAYRGASDRCWELLHASR